MITQETIEVSPGEKTPSGGVKSTAYYRDKDGNPTDKEEAVEMEVIEYDEEGRAIASTFLTL